MIIASKSARASGLLRGGVMKMTAEQKKEKILSAIASRGWFTAECYWNEACELRNAGLVRLGERFSTGGNRKPVWVKA